LTELIPGILGGGIGGIIISLLTVRGVDEGLGEGEGLLEVM
jgi:hypothetical protein